MKTSKNLLGFTIIAMSFSSCVLWPVTEQDVVGTYQAVLEDGTPGLPDGGSEILDLKPDGICRQEIALKDGRTLSAQGTWKWDKRNSNNAVLIKGIYWVVAEGRINPDLEKSLKTVVQGCPVGRTLGGQVRLGSNEGSHYEKK